MGKFFDITRKKSSVFENTNKPTSKSRNFLVYYFIIIILAIIFIYSFSSLAAKPGNETKDSQVDPKVKNANSELNNSNTEANLPNPPDSSKSDNTTNNQNFSSNNNDLNKTKISIKVLNGSTKSGIAAQAKEKLEKEGFVITEIGNTKNIYVSSVIYFSSGNEESADLVKNVLSGYEITTENNNEMLDGFDLVVVIGQK